MSRWWLVRHAPVAATWRGRIVGRLDADLDGAPAFARTRTPWPADALWVVSPALRARRTAEALGAPAWHEEPRFTEQDHGAWEGRTWDEVLAADPLAEAYLRAYHRLRPPGGEHLGDVRRRALRAFAAWNQRAGGRDVVAVMHAGPIRCLVAAALLAPTRRAMWLDVAPASWTLLEGIGGTWRVGAVNRPLPTDEERDDAPTAR